MPILLSYSTIANCLQPNNSHNWLSKVMGFKPEDKAVYHEGKIAHDLIQKHLSGKQIDPRLNHINYKFPIVEERDFDERCKFTFPLKLSTSPKGKIVTYDPDKGQLLADGKPYIQTNIRNYEIIGFFDGLDEENKRFLEIKSGGNGGWSLMKFQQSMQRKLYALAKPTFKEAICISCQRDPEKWEKEKAKVFIIPLTESDRKEATEWIIKAIETIEKGDFTGGLTDGVCLDKWCYFGSSCQFK